MRPRLSRAGGGLRLSLLPPTLLLQTGRFCVVCTVLGEPGQEVQTTVVTPGGFLQHETFTTGPPAHRQ